MLVWWKSKVCYVSYVVLSAPRRLLSCKCAQHATSIQRTVFLIIRSGGVLPGTPPIWMHNKPSGMSHLGSYKLSLYIPDTHNRIIRCIYRFSPLGSTSCSFMHLCALYWSQSLTNLVKGLVTPHTGKHKFIHVSWCHSGTSFSSVKSITTTYYY